MGRPLKYAADARPVRITVSLPADLVKAIDTNLDPVGTYKRTDKIVSLLRLALEAR